jgi:predicted ester cyclase
MSVEENKAIARRFIEEIINEGNIAAVDEVIAADFASRPTGDREDIKQGVIEWRAAFPDSWYIIEDAIAEGDKVVLSGTFSGTHKSEFMGIAATGNEVTGTWIGIYRTKDGKLVERWLEYDSLGFFQQLGVVPSIAEDGE